MAQKGSGGVAKIIDHPGRAGKMTKEEIDEFLNSGIWLMKVGVIKEDGWPAVIPLWYHWDGQYFYAVGRKRSEWVHDLRRNPHAGICVEELQAPPNRKVLAQCIAEVVDGPCVAEGSKWLPIANQMALRYLGPRGPEYLKATYNWERCLVRFAPVDGKLITWQGVSWASRYLDPNQLRVRG